MDMGKEKPYILVVEDDAEMCETLSDILPEEGYEVKTAGKGKEALAIAREEKEKFPFAICLIDLKLPDIDGIRVLEEIKHINPGTYAIIITAFASKDSAVEALKAGAYSYVEKPVNTWKSYWRLLKELLRATSCRKRRSEWIRNCERAKSCLRRYLPLSAMLLQLPI